MSVYLILSQAPRFWKGVFFTTRRSLPCTPSPNFEAFVTVMRAGSPHPGSSTMPTLVKLFLPDSAWPWTTRFFYRQHFFQFSLSVAFSWIELQMLLRCCLIHILTTIILQQILYLVYLYLSLGLDLLMSYLFDLFFIFSLLFVVINHIVSLKKTNLFSAYISPIIFGWWRECRKQIIFKEQKISLWVLLSLCLIFCQFQPSVAYKVLLIKKACFSYKAIVLSCTLVNNKV